MWDNLITSIFTLPNTVWWTLGGGLVLIGLRIGWLYYDRRAWRIRVEGYDFSSQDSRRKE